MTRSGDDAGRLFDRYVVVDWSAKNSPATGKDSIWIADLRVGEEAILSNPPTRRAAALELDTVAGTSGRRRTLLAVDVALGYPRGSACRFALRGAAPWSAMWQTLEREIVDDERNRNNRFDVAAALNRRGAETGPGPFWGRHRGSEVAGLTVTKPPAFKDPPEHRACERWLRACGRRPASPWQLLGAGSVGGQSLTLIPILERLRRRCDAEVWPFTSGLTAGSRPLVIAEIWPTSFDIDMPAHWTRDAAQVDGVARRLAGADAEGALRNWFEPAIAEGDRDAVVDEEGWILGVQGNRT